MFERIYPPKTSALDDGAGSLRKTDAQRGASAYAGVFGRTDRTETGLSVLEISQGYRNDVGFVAQAGTRKLVAKQNLQWFELGPLNQFHACLNTERTEVRGSGLTLLQRWTPGVWMARPRNSELVVEWTPAEKSRVQHNGPRHDAHYVHVWGQTAPGAWASLIQAWFDTGRLVDVQAGANGRVVPGRKYGFELKARPLPWPDLQPRVDALVLDNPIEGQYREVASQLLAVWHLSAGQTLRLIA